MTITAPARSWAADSERAHLYPLTCDEEVVRFRQHVRTAAVEAGLRLVDQTKLVTAASELARNALEHGGGGLGEITPVEATDHRGVRLVVEDDGPGIPDVALALTDGFTLGTGMGLGLPGSRRLVDVFEVWSEVGVGTCVTVEKWAS